MSPIIEPRSIVCIDSQQRDPDRLDGSIVAMKDNEDGCSIKRLKIEKNYLIGIPENIEEYNSIVFLRDKSNPIIGKVVLFWSQLEI